MASEMQIQITHNVRSCTIKQLGRAIERERDRERERESMGVEVTTRLIKIAAGFSVWRHTRDYDIMRVWEGRQGACRGCARGRTFA